MTFFWAVASMMLRVVGRRLEAVAASPVATAARRRLMAVRRRERWPRLRSRAMAFWRMRFSADLVLAIRWCSPQNKVAPKCDGNAVYTTEGSPPSIPPGVGSILFLGHLPGGRAPSDI